MSNKKIEWNLNILLPGIFHLEDLIFLAQKKNDSICDKPPCPQDPDSWLAIINQCNVNVNAPSQSPTSSGACSFHSWHKHISVKPIISIETTNICKLLVQFCKSRFEGSPTMDSGQMMLFLGWVGIPQAICVKTIRW